jgi:hypothetical protein
MAMATYGSGDHVKVEFRNETTGESEWMWVRVDYADDCQRLVFGWLDNEPLINQANLRLGQHLAISYDKIREHKPTI